MQACYKHKFQGKKNSELMTAVDVKNMRSIYVYIYAIYKVYWRLYSKIVDAVRQNTPEKQIWQDRPGKV